MNRRAISAAVDAALCLLLVGASVLTVSAVAPVGDRADPAARRGAVLLGTSTTSVEYSVGNSTRVARGTVAGLLADAAVDGSSRVSGYERAVTAAVRRTLAGLDGETRAVASWRPAPADPVRNRVTVGPRPPRDADVRAARIVVPADTVTNRTARGRVAVVIRWWRP